VVEVQQYMKYFPLVPAQGLRLHYQLIDLDRARDEGIISEAEYERTKQDFLDSAR
jgi:hypothetical protein